MVKEISLIAPRLSLIKDYFKKYSSYEKDALLKFYLRPRKMVELIFEPRLLLSKIKLFLTLYR